MTVTLSNVGGGPVTWSTTTGPAGFRGVASPFSASPANGTLPGGRSVVVTVSFDRSWPAEGPAKPTTLTFVGGGARLGVALAAVVARPPVITNAAGFVACTSTQPAGIFLSAIATITDETAPLAATVSLVDPTGLVYPPVPTAVKGDEHSALVDLDADGDGVVEIGEWAWTIRAIDGFDNVAAVSGLTNVSRPVCP